MARAALARGVALNGAAAAGSGSETLERAHAKVNLGLSVLARRGDGYHEIETVMVSLALHDEVAARVVASGVRLVVEGAELSAGEDNLAVRAARAYLGAARASAGLALRLRKRIPVAAGLGGGSSDAAAVLRAAARLLPADVDLLALGRALGSDVPFFLSGLPAALARGRGERLEPLSLPPVWLVLAFPGVPVRAADAYQALQSFTPRLRPEALVQRLQSGGDPGLVNALQPGVVRAHPVVRDVVKSLRAEGLRGAVMSGSGSCCLALAADEQAAREAAERLRAGHPGWTIHATHSA
ncbi:MAG: 4-(cytidine 5'-diphospho)-2-C-methyl-D-erythritol kinase [Deinococcales bacterium]